MTKTVAAVTARLTHTHLSAHFSMFSLSIRNALASTVIATFFFKRDSASARSHSHHWHLKFAPASVRARARALTRVSSMITFFTLSIFCIGILSDKGLSAMTLPLYSATSMQWIWINHAAKWKIQMEKNKMEINEKIFDEIKQLFKLSLYCDWTGFYFFLSSIHSFHSRWMHKKKCKMFLSVIHFGINNWKSNFQNDVNALCDCLCGLKDRDRL